MSPVRLEGVADPFVKWAGGKRQLADKIVEQIGKIDGSYYEPFVGGGAIFFALAGRGLLHSEGLSFLSDTNVDLMKTYLAIQTNVTQLLTALDHPLFINDEKTYYKVRNEPPAQMMENPSLFAARFLYLNRTAYNGLYRVNKKHGKFNVPFGRYDHENGVFSADFRLNLRRCAKTLLRAFLHDKGTIGLDFEKLVETAEAGDTVYFDPPYLPLKSKSFAEYQKLPFGEPEHQRLAACARRLGDGGVHVVLSSSGSEKSREIYSEFGASIVDVEAKRSVNCKVEGRGNVSELICEWGKP